MASPTAAPPAPAPPAGASPPARMIGAVLPGDSTVRLREFDVPEPGHGEVLLRVKASAICGSDIRCIYHEHLGRGPEGYQGVIAGHEPCGQVAAVGPGCRRFGVGDRVVVYHISGCGLCHDCRRGYMISCTSERWRRAYGWQRDGGMAPYMIAEEKDLIELPEPLTWADGALVACGFGTAWEGLCRVGVRGGDEVLVTGLGPVGLAAAMLARAAGAARVIGTDASPDRLANARGMGLCDDLLPAGEGNAGEVRALTGGRGASCAVECSAHPAARATAIRATADRGRVVFLGEGGDVSFQPSADLMHGQKTLEGSWVTSTWRMEELVGLLVRWGLHPDRIVTHRFALEDVGDAYALMASGRCGKVIAAFDEALQP